LGGGLWHLSSQHPFAWQCAGKPLGNPLVLSQGKDLQSTKSQHGPLLYLPLSYVCHGVAGTKVGLRAKPPSLWPRPGRQPPPRHTQARLCQFHRRGNLSAGRRWFSSGFPCQAPERASHWWKLGFDLLFRSFCQLNI